VPTSPISKVGAVDENETAALGVTSWWSISPLAFEIAPFIWLKGN
jgi:hypothetical protein